MPQIGGKPVKKSSKTKSSSTSKRHFTVVIGSKEHGLYCSSSPSSAARKAVSKLCGKNVKNVEFCLREITQGSKKKTYGPYLGHVEKLAKPIQLKGRLVERMPVALLKAKSSSKKGGMRGGGGNNNEGIEMRNMTPLSKENMERLINEFKKSYKLSKNHGYNTNLISKSFKNRGLSNNNIEKAINSINPPIISMNNV